VAYSGVCLEGQWKTRNICSEFIISGQYSNRVSPRKNGHELGKQETDIVLLGNLTATGKLEHRCRCLITKDLGKIILIKRIEISPSASERRAFVVRFMIYLVA
jgi:hypothetical protein